MIFERSAFGNSVMVAYFYIYNVLLVSVYTV